VWGAAIVGAVLVGLIAQPAGRDGWFSLVLAGTILLTFIIQLALPTKQGLVLRMAASIGGAVIVLAVATAVLLLVRA
jgi:hypothetical protein